MRLAAQNKNYTDEPLAQAHTQTGIPPSLDTNREGTESVVPSAYGQAEFQDNYPDGIENDFWHAARHKILTRKLRRVAGADDIMLDVGCGRGITVEYLRQRGFNCFGVEVGRPLLKPDVQPYISIGTSALELPENMRKSVKIILLLDVLEHIQESTAFLKDCRERFSNLKHVVATVPARMELWSNYDERFGHFRRYSRATLREELDRAGFQEQGIGYAFHSLYPLFFYLARIHKRRNSKLSAPTHLYLHKLMSTFLSADELICPGALVGTSLVAVASVGR